MSEKQETERVSAEEKKKKHHLNPESLQHRLFQPREGSNAPTFALLDLKKVQRLISFCSFVV